MYCSACGSLVPESLTYCNRCGARSRGGSSDNLIQPSEVFPATLIWAMVATFVMGIAMIVGLIAVLRQVDGINLGIILSITLICFSLMAALEFVFVWLLMRGRRQVKRIQGSETEPPELQAAHARALQEPSVSVTEHTTRTFEPLYSERKSR